MNQLLTYRVKPPDGPQFFATVVQDDGGPIVVMTTRNGTAWEKDEALESEDLMFPEYELNEWDVDPIEPEDAPPMAVTDYSPDQPRDEGGRWSETGGGGGGGGEASTALKGYSKNAKLKNGVIYTTDVDDAAKALYEGRRVELDQVRSVSVLLDRLAAVTERMIQRGEKAPTVDLCKVTIQGTNLFCVESKGIPRIEMPQMDEAQTKKFIEHLVAKGHKVSNEDQYASYLRATQNELNGSKVAGIAKAMRSGEHEKGPEAAQVYKSPRIVVSDDDYVLDGHHRWAAKVGNDSIDGILTNDTKLEISRVDMTITQLLEEAHEFTGGKGRKGVGDRKPAKDYSPDQPRDESGRWSDTGGGGDVGGLAYMSPGVPPKPKLKESVTAAGKIGTGDADLVVAFTANGQKSIEVQAAGDFATRTRQAKELTLRTGDGDHEVAAVTETVAGAARTVAVPGAKYHVDFPDVFLDSIRHSDPKWDVHHNHPTSPVSLSEPDILFLNNIGGIRDLYAHTTDGGSFRARMVRPLPEGEFALDVRKISNRIEAAEQFIDVPDGKAWGFLRSHAFNTILANKKLIQYEATLSAQQKKWLVEGKGYFDHMVSSSPGAS